VTTALQFAGAGATLPRHQSDARDGRTMTRILLALSVFACATAVAVADVYRWKDGDGNVIFSDKPHEGAEKIELRETTVVPGVRPTTRLSPDDAERAPQALSYETLVIVEPPAEATLRNTQTVNVSVAATPPLQVAFGHRLQLYLDGGAYGIPTTRSTYVLDEVARGAHTLEAAVLDSSGAEVARSAPSTFYLHQPSIAKPNQAAPSGAP